MELTKQNFCFAFSSYFWFLHFLSRAKAYKKSAPKISFKTSSPNLLATLLLET